MLITQLRYSFRLYPNVPQRSAPARAFGCSRVVYNDALRARETARVEGAPFPKTGDLSKLLITDEKKTDERGWLGEVSAVVLQQSAGSGYGVPELLRWAQGQATVHGLSPVQEPQGQPAGRQVHRERTVEDHHGRGPVVAENRRCAGRMVSRPSSVPSTVTVVRDAAGRYFASFVVETAPEQALPGTDAQVGIDLGLSHFAILSEGTKIDAPRFLRRAEKKLKKEQRRLSRKTKASNNRTKARLEVARAHAQVADARREFHHQLSTRIIRDNCENQRVLSRSVA